MLFSTLALAALLLHSSPSFCDPDPLLEAVTAAETPAAKVPSVYAAVPAPQGNADDLDDFVTLNSLNPSGQYGFRLRDLSRAKERQGRLLAGGLSPGEICSDGLGKEPATAAAAAPTRPSWLDIPMPERRDDGALVFLDDYSLNVIGFYGLGGSDDGISYSFTGTGGYSGYNGTTHILPVALSLAGVSSDHRQSVYSAEIRAEASLKFEDGGEVYPFAGYRTVVLQPSDKRSVAELGGVEAFSPETRTILQVPLGVGFRVKGEAGAKSTYFLNGTLGGILNLGTSRSEGRDREMAPVSGVGSLGVGLESGAWNFQVGADIGVTSDGEGGTGVSASVRRVF